MKKGQFYILTAIVLCSLVFAFATRVADINAPFKKSEYLYENYLQEVYISINTALLESSNVSARFIEFTDDYTAYARDVDTNFSALIVLKSEDLLVLNRFKIPFNITTYDDIDKYGTHTWTEVLPGEQIIVPIRENLDVDAGPRTFTIDLEDYSGDYYVAGLYKIERKYYRFR